MKKRYSLLAAMVFGAFLGFSQTASLPITEDFELETQNQNCNATINLVSANFVNVSTDGVQDWSPDAGGTSSSSTGPAVDHSPGTGAGIYLYTETSGCNNRTVSLESVHMDWSAFSGVKIEFWYHMFGATMGTMHLDMRVGSGAWTNDVITSWTGNVDQWMLQSHSVFDTAFVNKDSVQMRIRGLTGTSFTSDMAIDDIAITPIVSLNLAGAGLTSPSFPFCAGPALPVAADFLNDGTDTITSFTTIREINGVQDSTTFTGSLVPGATQNVAFPAFTFASGVVYDVKIWTKNPNGMADQAPADDTVSVLGARTGLPAGNYTLNPANPSSATNFTSFADLGTALSNFGTCGAVNVTVSPGTYSESLNLSGVTGPNELARVTIDGGDSSTTTITSANYFTVALDGVSYITLKNMKIENTNATASMAVLFGNGSNYNEVTNSIIEVSTTSTNFNITGVGTSTSTTARVTGASANHNTVANSVINGGYYQTYFYGNNTTLQVGNKIMNNDFNDGYYYGVYVYYQDSVEVVGNNIDMTSRNNTQADGAYIWYTTNALFTENWIHAPDYGAYIYNFTQYAPERRQMQVVNNMIISDTDFGMYLLYQDSVDIFHNSIVTNGTVNPAFQIGASTTNTIESYDVRNNIFSSANTEAFEMSNVTDTLFTKLDNNAYNSGGANTFNIANTTYADLTAFKTANPNLNGASIEGDPQFASPTNLHIIGAFVNDGGDNSVSILTDIDGDVRPASGATNVDIGADEFSPPLCPPPSNLGSVNPSLDSVTIFWTGGAVSTFEYEVVASGAAQGSGTGVISGSDSVRIGGLTASTTYDYYVREICGRGDSSIWIGPSSFSTANGIPYFQDFENFGTNLTGLISAEGWSTNNTPTPHWESGSSTSSSSTGPTADHTTGSGTFLYLECSGGTTGDDDTLFSPSIFVDPAFTAIELSFWYHMFGAAMGSLEVYIESAGVNTLITTITGQQQSAQGDAWLNFATNLSGYNGNSVRLKFVGIRGTSFTSDMAIDDVALNVLAPVNAGVIGLMSPSLPLCPGTVTPVAAVKNFGLDSLTSVKVLWNVNGVLDSTTYTTTILSGDTAAVTLAPLTINSTTIYDIDIYTKDPNGMVDPINADDTTSLDGLRTGLSGNFTIDTSLAASATNWQSFTAFANDISNYGVCGAVIVDVAPGTYTEQFEINGLEGTDSASTITINGHNATITFGSTNANQRAVVTLDDASWITIDSLNIVAAGGTYGWGLQNINGTHHVTLSNSTIDVGFTSTSSFFAGIVNSGSRTSPTASGGSMHDINIINNEIIGGWAGITSYGDFNAPTQYNFNISNNTIRDFYNYGNYILYTDSVTIEGNDITRANRTVVSTFYGVLLSTGCDAAVINGNAIHNISDAAPTSTSLAYPLFVAADAAPGADNYITNNLIYNINNNGTIYALYGSSPENAHFVNNTVSLDEVNSTSTGIVRGIYQLGASNTEYTNNIITISRGGTGTKHGVYMTGAPSSCDYNNIYITSTGGTNSYGFFSVDQTSLSDWQTNTAYGANSHETDPQYVSLATDDFEPGNGLINAVGLGHPNITTDFFGLARSASNPDIGAIEFTPPASNNLGFTGVAGPVISTDSCYGSSEDVIVTVINAGGTILDFTASNATLTVGVTGGVTANLSMNITNNSFNGGNPLAIGSTMDVNMGSINMTNSGNYNLNGLITMATDTFPQNDTLVDTLMLAPVSGGTIAGSDTICMGDTVTISTSNFVGTIQWQVLNGTTWTDITGADSSELTINPMSLTSYRVLACGTVSSDTLDVLPITLVAPRADGDTAVAASCNIAATAVGTAISSNPNPTFDWYDAATGGNKISTGGAYSVSTDGDSISWTQTPTGTMQFYDTVWVEEVTAGGAGGSSLLITEADPGSPDMLEIQNVSSNGVDVTGWSVAVSNSYTDINNTNTTVQTLSGIMPSGALDFWTDAATNAWGSNLFWNPGSPGWIIIVDNLGNIVDFVIWEWSAADIATMSITVNGFTITPGASGAWIGNGIVSTGIATGSSMYRQGSSDNDDITDFIVNTIDQGVTNTGLTLPFAGGGCASPRAVAYLGVECVVGIEDIAAVDYFSINPNPSNGLFKLNIKTQQAEEFILNVRDVSGKLVFNEQVNVNGAFQRDLDFTGFAKGIYFLQIQTGEESRIEKLIIK